MGTINIKTSFRFFQFIFFIFKPKISIDGGEAQKTDWGQTSYEVTPGQHKVHIEIPYVFTSVAKATTTVSVAASESVSLAYRPPMIVFMKGHLETV